MTNLSHGLLALDRLAQAHGHGLRPEFRKALLGPAAHSGSNVTPLDVPQHRSGPDQKSPGGDALPDGVARFDHHGPRSLESEDQKKNG